GVLAELPDAVGRFGFSHALMRETLYSGLSAARRAVLHHEVGRAIEALYKNDLVSHLPRLARHFSQAGRDAWPKAVAYARQAGDEAMRQLAFEQAVTYYGQALGALIGDDRAASQQRGELLLALGLARAAAGDSRAAVEAHREAAEIAS